MGTPEEKPKRRNPVDLKTSFAAFKEENKEKELGLGEKITKKVKDTLEGVRELTMETNFDAQNENYHTFDIGRVENIPSRFHQSIAVGLIEAGREKDLLLNLEKFIGPINGNLIAQKIFAHGDIGEFLYHCKSYMQQFKDINLAKFVEKAIEEGKGSKVAFASGKLSEYLDAKKIAFDLIEAGEIEAVMKKMIMYPLRGNAKKEVAFKALELKRADLIVDIGYIPKELRDFAGEIAIKMIETGQSDYVPKFLLGAGEILKGNLAHIKGLLKEHKREDIIEELNKEPKLERYFNTWNKLYGPGGIRNLEK